MSDFVGDLPKFISLIGGEKFGDIITPIDTAGSVIGGPGATAAGIMKGFNDAYRPLANFVDDECPGMSGDVHVRTIDGRAYDFQAVGEYLALRSDDGEVEIQIRLAPRTDHVSVTQAIAIGVDGHVLLVDDAADEPVTVDGDPLGTDEVITTSGDALIVRTANVVGVIWPDVFTQATVRHLGRSALSLNVTLDADRSGRVQGLLGNGNLDPSDDLALPDGTLVDASFEDLHGTYRDAWRVTGDESILPGPSLYDASLPVEEVRLTAEQRAEGRRVCLEVGVYGPDALESCTIDVGITGERHFAEAALAGQRTRLVIAGDCDPTGTTAVAGGVTPGRSWATSAGPSSGEIAWTFAPEDREPVIASGAADDDMAAFVDSRFGFVALDTSTGQERWAAPDDNYVATEPAITEDAVFAVSQVGLVGLDRATGTLCWVVSAMGSERFHQPTVADGRLVVHSSVGPVTVVQVRDAVTGQLRWERPLDVPVVPAVAVSDGRVFVVGVGTQFHAFDLASGDPVWTEDLPGTPTAVSIVDGRAFVGIRGAVTGVVALDVRDGDIAWQAAIPGGLPRLASDGDVVVASDGTQVYAFEAEDGVPRWVNDEAERLAYDKSQPLIAGDRVLLQDARENRIVGIDLTVGSITLDLPTGPLSDAPPLVSAGGFLLSADRNGLLTSYR